MNRLPLVSFEKLLSSSTNSGNPVFPFPLFELVKTGAQPSNEQKNNWECFIFHLPFLLFKLASPKCQQVGQGTGRGRKAPRRRDTAWILFSALPLACCMIWGKISSSSLFSPYINTRE